MPSFKIDKYMFLFTRKRKRLCILTTFVMSILFITYQFIVYYMVSKEPIDTIRENVITGTHIKDKYFYTPSKDGKFTCIKSGEVIDFSKVNDDYCDCADSTDEPGTNACPDGIFFCDTVSENKKYPKMVPSSKVNDGICDCCDGSEEYKNHRIFKNGLGSLVNIPCPNVC